MRKTIRPMCVGNLPVTINFFVKTPDVVYNAVLIIRNGQVICHVHTYGTSQLQKPAASLSTISVG